MNLKIKNWLWKFTWPFAHNNWTLVNPNTLYCPKGKYTSKKIIEHEKIHAKQMREFGLYKFLFLYLFCLPFLYNPWRWKWEYEAYRVGSGWTHKSTVKILRSKAYGWLRG